MRRLAKLKPALQTDINHNPRERLEDDALQRTQWTQGVANAIQNGNLDPLCICLDGLWGSGKSTAVNFVLQQLRSVKSPLLGIANVNAWELGENDNPEKFLHNAMRLAIHSLIFRFLQSPSISGIRLIFLYPFLRLAQISLEPVKDNTMQSIVGVLTVFATLLAIKPDILRSPLDLKSLTFFQIILMIVVAIPVLLLFWNIILNAFNGLLENQSKRVFKSVIQNLPGKLIIVIEDLDRVSLIQLENIFRLMQTKFWIRRVVFVLPMSRAAVTKMLKHDGIDGIEDTDTYLERIVQITLALPPIYSRDLRNVLNEHLTQILPELYSILGIDNFFNDSFRDISDFFTDLRSVNRFLHALSFTTGALRKNGILEVNARDLVLVELLRLLEPKVYLKIAALRDELVGNYNIGIFDRKRLDIGAAILKLAVHPERVEHILRHLFEVSERLFDVKQGVIFPTFQRSGSQRIESMAFFDLYFLHLEPQTSFGLYQELIATTRGRFTGKLEFKDAFKNILKTESNHRIAFQNLETAFLNFDRGADNVNIVAQALKELEFELDPEDLINLCRLTVDFLQQHSNAVNLGLSLFGNTNKLSMIHGFLLHSSHGLSELTIPPYSAQHQNARDQLKSTWLRLFDEAERSGALLQMPQSKREYLTSLKYIVSEV
jgi:KAP family P-loop domain